ncbi:hypothetical protein JOD64_004711 [Micromonospora luteifusca]|uniref:Uncharacterized protein n=1 Tax=Micromonospora luteifusca TaxID=709860 RepID=A0ABS2M0P5_9ACTN|nr:hypothetical protein [Micromonospora luteifusca]MBM7493489.1 hypothetical protein [Micromonospora luteifusca]
MPGKSLVALGVLRESYGHDVLTDTFPCSAPPVTPPEGRDAVRSHVLSEK